MRLFFCCLLLFGIGALAEERIKRQASYTFPGPRNERAYRQPPSQVAPVYTNDDDDRDEQQAPRRQFQAQPVQPQYAPVQQSPRQTVYEPPKVEAPKPRTQSNLSARRRASTRANSVDKYAPATQPEEEEENNEPDPLTLLLQDSQFSCGEKNDGYYADDSVNCQVFHYCVGGAKHSWMCPENTVFHQVHLNCVPDAQDICAQSQKFHFVNDYLYKPVDYDGPNNTARYSQRYYPDNYVVGDPLVAPQQQAPRRPVQQVQSYPPSPPRNLPRQVASPTPSRPVSRAPHQSSQGYSQPSQPSRPASRPIQSYPTEAPPSYRGGPEEEPPVYRIISQPQSAPTRPAQPQQVIRQQPPSSQARGPPPQVYRVVSTAQDSPSPHSGYSSEENPYQPQARRPSVPVQTYPAAGYAPPRQTYRARSAEGYPVYASNQRAGVQYDEEY